MNFPATQTYAVRLPGKNTRVVLVDADTFEGAVAKIPESLRRNGDCTGNAVEGSALAALLRLDNVSDQRDQTVAFWQAAWGQRDGGAA